MKKENFDFRGLIMYWLKDGKFKEIKVACNCFTYTDSTGKTVEFGIPH